VLRRALHIAAHIRAVERRRAEAQNQLLARAASPVVPSRRTVRAFSVAFLLAGGAFVLTMLKDPPKSVASDPTAAAVTEVDLQVPTGLPGADCILVPLCP
jgi:hypothetical protein